MASRSSREVRLKKRPVAMPKPDDFEIATVEVSNPQSGQLLVRNRYMSVDPYMRGRMVDRKSYTPPFQLGQPLQGGCVGEVIESHNEQFSVGDYVLGMLGWREWYLSDGRHLQKIDPDIAPLQSYLGVAGMPGQTAYFGLLDIGQPKEGETVFVSAASGAVGATACQIAKIKGCRVVGSAGSDHKVAWLLEEAGINAAFNYKATENLINTLAKQCPDGIDVYFENVGGEHLEAALTLMNNHGRIPCCGMIAQYNATERVRGPSNLATIIGKRIKLQGFIVTDYAPRRAEFYDDMGKWIANGQMKWQETILEGIENAPRAFIGLFKGDNLGKMLVKL